METIKEKDDFTKILEKLSAQKGEGNQPKEKNIEQFDFQRMFIELERTLKEYQNEYSKKNTESELKLSELTLTT
jgi:hypothetical protein